MESILSSSLTLSHSHRAAPSRPRIPRSHLLLLLRERPFAIFNVARLHCRLETNQAVNLFRSNLCGSLQSTR